MMQKSDLVVQEKILRSRLAMINARVRNNQLDRSDRSRPISDLSPDQLDLIIQLGRELIK